MAELSERIAESLALQQRYLNLHATVLLQAGVSLAAALARGNKLIAVGCPVIAGHMVAELTGRFVAERPGLPGIALSENTMAVTAIFNDYGREQVYARQLAALAQDGDFVVGFVAGVDYAARAAINEAQKIGLETLALEMEGADESIAIETFLTAAHILCEEAEAELQRLKPEWFPAALTVGKQP